MVAHPSHYTEGCSMECIDVMQMVFGSEALALFCLMNMFKYLWRWKLKNGKEDVKKAEWYNNKLKTLPVNHVLLLRNEIIDVVRSMLFTAKKELGEEECN
jgi:hypothetical protein